MYNYDFTNEKVVFEKVNCVAEINQKEVFVSILLTEQNLLLFYNSNRGILKEKIMGVIVGPEYELLLKISLNDIKYTCEDNNTYIDNVNVTIFDFDLSKVLNS